MRDGTLSDLKEQSVRDSNKHKPTLRRGCVVLAMAALFLSASTNAATGWTNWGEVAELVQGYPGGTSDEMVFFVANVTSNPSSCGASTGFYFPVTNERQKRMFALLIAAKMAGNRVQLYTVDTCLPSGWNQNLITGIVVE
jgi:hypothetical protein